MNMQSVQGSSNIKSAGFEPATGKMHVEFKSGLAYEYEDVKPDEWAAFEGTFDQGESTGSHFAQNFRHRKGTKLEA